MKTTKRKIHWLALPLIILFCSVASLITIFTLNEYSLVLSIPEKITYLEYGVDSLPDVTALCRGTILSTQGIPVETSTEGTIDFKNLGTYEVTYSSAFDHMKITETRTFVIQDTLAPTIELVSDPEHFTSPVAQYEEEG